MKQKSKAILGQLSDMDLRLLRVFKSVVDCGGMAAAELELNIGMSTISRHVKDLELRLGLTLCRRGRGGFALTPEGSQVYAQTLQLLAATDEFRRGIDDIHGRMGGELHLAVFDKTATNPLARIGQAMAMFVQRAPEVQLHLHVGSLTTIERGVMDGSFQLGIIPAHRPSQSLDYLGLFDETMLLYCGRGHPLFEPPPAPLDWKDLRRHPFAGLGYHSPNMEQTHQRQLRRSATGYDQESIATLILSGHFLGFLPDHYARLFEQDGLMRPVQPDTLHYRVRFEAITRRSPRPGRETQILWDCLGLVHGG